MENNELYHHGILGMKWGLRRYQNKDGTLTDAGKKRYKAELSKLRAQKKVLDNKEKTKAKLDKLEALKKEIDDKKRAERESLFPKKESKKENGISVVKKSKKASEMTDEELRQKIQRIELEKRYKDLMKQPVPQKQEKSSQVQEFVSNVLKRSGENVATQFTTYVMGRGVNKLFEKTFSDKQIVNPKKGQKDK